MSRIFLVGIGPLMDGGARRVTAHAVRAWRFVSALRHAGHDVNLCTFSQNISPHDPMERMVEPRAKDGFAYENLDMRMGNVLGYLSEQCRRLSPDCVIGVGTEPSGWACRMRPTAPVWADLHGWVMAEAQIKAAHDGSDEILSHFWRHERPVLLRADKISVVSTPQRFALLGELGTAGRLNRHNVGYDLVVTIPSCFIEPASHFPLPTSHLPLTARLTGRADAFIVIWNGAFNTWTDPDTLADGLEWAMARDPSVHFVATGGAVPGHSDAVYERFRERIGASPHRSRYHLLDWVAAEQLPSYLAGSHLAICVDFPCVETLTGTRTRLLEAMAYGLAVLMTRGTELSLVIEREGIGFVVDPGNPKALGEKILDCARDRERTALLGQQARQAVERDFGLMHTLAPVLGWAEQPCFAPDNAWKRSQSAAIDDVALSSLEAHSRSLGLEKRMT